MILFNIKLYIYMQTIKFSLTNFFIILSQFYYVVSWTVKS